ncbi:MAG TPA: GWxTD domain-containing protein, partial [Vicinamibacteria bacterium]|nr:GWxTD domain-containing protein [Vicinamibacteria bacterium]
MMTRFTYTLVALALFARVAGADERLDRLSDDHRAWLEEEVVYIITPEEREVFLNLGTVEERNLFLEAFWQRRDPNPATLENEAMVEHYRRLEYATRMLGRDAPRPGWKTDRGRYYIILGEPAEIQRYDGSNEVVSAELWLYNGDTRYRLPARFNLLFFKDNDVGEYELYHPYSHGPERLLHDGFSLRTNQNIAVDILETISVDLARASLTIDLSEPTAQMFSGRNTRDPMLLQVRPSMAVDSNLADIVEYPRRKVNTDYLDGYLKYGNRVTADYSFHYINSRAVFAVLVGPENTSFIHYSIEIDPENLSLEMNDDETAYYTTLQVSLELRNTEGQLLAISENQPFLQLTASQF